MLLKLQRTRFNVIRDIKFTQFLKLCSLQSTRNFRSRSPHRPQVIREHDGPRPRQSRARRRRRRETQPISGTSPFSGWGAASMHNLSLHFARMGSRGARPGVAPGRRGGIVGEVRGRSGNSVTGLVTLVSRTPSGCRQPPKLRKSPGARRVSFSTRFHEPFVPDIRDTYDHVYLRSRPYLSSVMSLLSLLSCCVATAQWFANFISVTRNRYF